ncbi:MAG: TIGR04255 family protein [Candidatus Obscuribacterales bacterium]|nr:TIGR04255 family protein [Candidatus Obscuribacterales bacterium]
MPNQKHRKYKKPPVTEAACQLTFAGDPLIDIVLPGRLHAKIASFYSAPPKLIHEQSLGFNQGIGLSGLSAPTQKIQFINSDHKRMFVVGPSTISVHDFAPYTGWEKFKPRIIRAFQDYEQVAGTRPIKQVGLRYINRIVLPASTTELKDYFKAMPERPERSEIPERISSLFTRFEFQYEDEPGFRGIVSLGNMANTENELGIPMFIDIDVVYAPMPNENADQGLIEPSHVTKFVEELRDKEYWLFESLITDKARELFE